MRVSINAIDGVIAIDGTPGITDCSQLVAENISAVQWYDDKGEIEFAGHSQPNEKITDFSPYQSYVDNVEPLPPAVEPLPPPEPPPPPPIRFEPPPVLTPAEQLWFDHENRILALEGKPPMPQKEFMAMLKQKTERYMALMNAAMQAALNAPRVS